MARGWDFLVSRGMGAAVPAPLCAGEASPGEDKSQPRHCGTGDRGPCRPSATFKPSEARWFALGRQHEKTGSAASAQEATRASRTKRCPGVQLGVIVPLNRTTRRPRYNRRRHAKETYAEVEWSQRPDIIVLSTISNPFATDTIRKRPSLQPSMVAHRSRSDEEPAAVPSPASGGAENARRAHAVAATINAPATPITCRQISAGPAIDESP